MKITFSKTETPGTQSLLDMKGNSYGVITKSPQGLANNKFVICTIYAVTKRAYLIPEDKTWISNPIDYEFRLPQPGEKFTIEF